MPIEEMCQIRNSSHLWRRW